MKSSLSFTRAERLKQRKDIETLFQTGKAFFLYPYKIYFLRRKTATTNAPLRLAISIPKKKFKRAVDRNRLKRQTREAYRLQKAILLNQMQNLGQEMDLMFVYIGTKQEPYPVIYQTIGQVFLTLLEKSPE